MKLYVAAAWDDFEIVRDVMRALEQAGHVVTHDWTKARDNYPDCATAPREERLKGAHADLNGVFDAEAILVVTSDKPSRGMWFEAGFACGMGIRILVVGPQRDACVFCTICEQYETIVEAIAALEAT